MIFSWRFPGKFPTVTPGRYSQTPFLLSAAREEVSGRFLLEVEEFSVAVGFSFVVEYAHLPLVVAARRSL